LVRRAWVIACVHGLALFVLCCGLTVHYGKVQEAMSPPEMKEKALDVVEQPAAARIWREAQTVLDASGSMPRLDLGYPPMMGPSATARVRELFPETLLWRPELITDDNGRATIDV